MKKEKIKIQKVTSEGITITIEADADVLDEDSCTVTVTADVDSNDIEGSLSATSTEKTCQKVARKAIRKLKKFINAL